VTAGKRHCFAWSWWNNCWKVWDLGAFDVEELCFFKVGIFSYEPWKPFKWLSGNFFHNSPTDFCYFIQFFIMRNFRGTCSSVEMLKGYMMREWLRTAALVGCRHHEMQLAVPRVLSFKEN